MDDKNQVVKKVKVSPYPISATIVSNPPTLGKIVKLTLQGFLIEVPQKAFVVAEKHEVMFTLPVVGHDIKELCVVIKSYDRFKNKTETQVEIDRLYEFHFKSLNLKNREEIASFLKKIGQTK